MSVFGCSSSCSRIGRAAASNPPRGVNAARRSTVLSSTRSSSKLGKRALVQDYFPAPRAHLASQGADLPA
jgi:hypothetical protein